MLFVSMNAVSSGPVNPEELRASRTMQDVGCLLVQPPRDSAVARPVDRPARNVTARCLVGCARVAAGPPVAPPAFDFCLCRESQRGRDRCA